MFEFPDSFASGVRAELGAAGEAWLTALPTTIDDLCQDWGLVREPGVRHGYCGLVVPVLRGHERFVLKISPHVPETAIEGMALASWNGDGTVLLIDQRRESGALLLERLDATRSLDALPIDDAVFIAATLLRRLAIVPPSGLSNLTLQSQAWPDQWRELYAKFERPFPLEYLDLAISHCQSLGPIAAVFLVNEDLHYENVLAGTREPWLVIDPKPVIGDVEYGVAPLLWNRTGEADGLDHRFQLIAGIAELDEELAHAWTLVRTIDYWLWALTVGLTKDLIMCRTIIEWLKSRA